MFTLVFFQGSAILQQNTGSMNNVGHVLPPPLIRVCNSTTPVVR